VQSVFFDGQSLREAVGLPLLGVVTLLRSDEDLLKEKSEFRKYSAALGSLVGAFLVGMLVLSLLPGWAG